MGKRQENTNFKIELNDQAKEALISISDVIRNSSKINGDVQKTNIVTFLIQQIFNFILMAGVCFMVWYFADKKILEGTYLIGLLGTIVGYIFGRTFPKNL